MNLSLHFTYEEACFSSTALRKGIANVPDEEAYRNMVDAAAQLEKVRDLLGYPVHVDSWYRSKALNRAVGGSKKSAHMEGWAVDFVCPRFGSPLQIVEALRRSEIPFDQLIMEGNWVHVSFHPKLRREVLAAEFGAGGVIYTKMA